MQAASPLKILGERLSGNRRSKAAIPSGQPLTAKGKAGAVSGVTDVWYPVTGAAVQAALPRSCLLENTPTQPNETVIYEGTSSCW